MTGYNIIDDSNLKVPYSDYFDIHVYTLNQVFCHNQFFVYLQFYQCSIGKIVNKQIIVCDRIPVSRCSLNFTLS